MSKSSSSEHKKSKYDEEEPGVIFPLALMGFLVPVMGLYMYEKHKYKHPRRAKSGGIGALIALIIFMAATTVMGIFFPESINNIMQFVRQ